MANILLVEDDPHINNINKQALTMEGYNVFTATSSQGCFEVLNSENIDLILLDIDLPDSSGLSICNKIKVRYNIPVIFLTAMGENSDIVKGLNAGGDDYISKPYSLAVLVARIKARLRLIEKSPVDQNVGKLVIDTVSGTAYYNGVDLLLTQRELLLLHILVKNKGRLVDREDLLIKIWGSDAVSDFNALRVLVSRIKTKLFDAGSDMRIETEWKKGYTFYPN